MTSYFSRAIDIYWHKNFSSEEWRDYIPKSLFIVTEALTPTLGPLGSRRGWSYRAEWISTHYIPSGKHTKNYGKSPFLMGKSTISMAILNCYVSLPEGNQVWWPKTAQLIAQQKNCGPLLSSRQRGLPSRWAGFGDLLLDIPQAIRSILTASDSQGWRCLSIDRLVNYPLVNIQKAMENHHFRRVNPL